MENGGPLYYLEGNPEGGRFQNNTFLRGNEGAPHHMLKHTMYEYILSAAHLPEADLQLTLPCRHSINVAGTSVPTDDWYGAERWVDAWLGPALDVVSKPRWLRKLVRR